MLSSILSQPKQQNAEATIITLCDRLTHSSMVEDRRAAALSLKTFSHNYRELIASSGLAGLLDALKTDSHDAELRRACLETLIVLFVKTGQQDLVETARIARERNKTYISPLLSKKQSLGVQGDEISLLLTDRFTEVPENIELLLQFVESRPDVYSTLYSLQLISAIVLNRHERACECLMALPNGISQLVRTLDSNNEMIRNEGILLLLNLTENNIDCQKLIAFEGTFEAVIGIINDEGGLGFGASVVIEDCLGLLRNLIEYNVSNQKLFCESGCVALFTSLLEFESDLLLQNDSATSNVSLALQFPRLFCVPGAEATADNQGAFQGALMVTLRLAFGPAAPLSVRVAALLTVASLVHDNVALQTQLSEVDVPYYDLSLSINVLRDPTVMPVTSALLNWMLDLNVVQAFDLRAACLQVLSSLFTSIPLRSSFINDQLLAYKANTENANIIAILAEFNENSQLNPFRVWFCCSLVINLFVEAPSIKDQFKAVQIGDESLGQEVVPIIQSIGSQLLDSLNYREPFAALGYLQLLSVWLFDDVPAVDEFLAESSVLQGLTGYVASTYEGKPNLLVQSLATILLGIAYDFSSKTSPVTRADFYKLLVGTLGADQYAQQVKRFRESSIYREYLPSSIFGAQKGENGLPRVYFDYEFYEFISENIARIQKALNKSPDFEPTSRVSLEMYEELRLEMIEKESTTRQYKADKEAEIGVLVAKESELSAELAELDKKHKDLLEQKLELDNKHAATLSAHTEASSKLAQTEKQLSELLKTHEATTKELAQSNSAHGASSKENKKLSAELAKVAEKQEKAEAGINKMTRELMVLGREKEAVEQKLKKVQKELEAAGASEAALKTKAGNLEQQLKQANESVAQLGPLKATNEKLVQKLREVAESLKEKEEEEALFAQSVEDLEKCQTELDGARQRLQNFEKEKQLAKQKLESLKKELDTKGSAEKSAQKELAEHQAGHKRLEANVAEWKSKHASLEAELEKERAKFQEEKAQHGQAVKALEDKVASYVQEIEELKVAHASELEGLKGELEGLRGELEGANKKLIGLKDAQGELKDTREQLAKLKEAHSSELEALKGAHSSELEALKGIHSSELQTAQDTHSKELQAAQDTHSREQEKLENAQKKLDDLKATHSSELAKLKERHSEELAPLKAASAELGDLKKTHGATSAELETAKAAAEELSTLQAAHKKLASELSAAREGSKQELKALKAEHAKALKDKQKLIDEHGDALSKLAAESESQTAQSESSKKVTEAFKARLAAKDKEAAELQAQLDKAESERSEELASLQGKLDAEISKVKELEKGAAKVEALEKEAAKVKGLEKEVAKVKALEKEAAKAKELEKEAAKVKELEKEAAKVKALEKEAAKVKELEQEAAKVQQLEKQVARISALEKEAAKVENLEKEAAKVKSLEKEAAKVKDLEKEAAKVKDLEKEAAKVKDLEKQAAKVQELEKQVARIGELEKEAARVKELEKEAAKVKGLEKQVTRIEELEKQAAKIKDLEKEAAKTKPLEKQVAQLNEEVAAHAKELVALKEAAKLKPKASPTPKDPALVAELEEKTVALDELMALLDDLTEQKSKYKQQLRSLDQEVSDSDSDSDDSD